MSRPDELRLRRAHEQLAAAVEQLAHSDGWRRMLAVAARLHHYSPHNVLLITVQRPDATRVAGYRTWQQLGRQVRKGQRGIAILAPVSYRHRDSVSDAQRDDPAATMRAVRGFRVAHVFDISQTDGPPLPEVRPRQLAGGGDPVLYAALAAQVQAAGYAFSREPCAHPDANGETSFPARTVRVRPDLPAAQAVKTLAHELAHVRLHVPDAVGGPVPRAVAEVEAESVAHLVVSAHGIDSEPYTVPYVAGWAGGAKGAVLACAERVLSTAASILDAAPVPRHDGAPATLRRLDREQAIAGDPAPRRSAERLAVQR
jgi:antirestriction protein ArdC